MGVIYAENQFPFEHGEEPDGLPRCVLLSDLEFMYVGSV